jgi:hypothetical protein
MGGNIRLLRLHAQFAQHSLERRRQIAAIFAGKLALPG